MFPIGGGHGHGHGDLLLDPDKYANAGTKLNPMEEQTSYGQ